VQNYPASWNTRCTANIAFFSFIGNYGSRGESSATVAMKRISGAPFTIVLTVILALNINVFLYRSPSKLKFIMHTAHPLTLMRRSLTFTCDACGEEGKSMFYLCAICPFFVHRECTSYPLLVKHIRHRHPLHLTNSLQQPQLNQSDHRVCLLCVKKVNTNLERTKLKCEDPRPSLLCCKYKYERATVRAY
jgi:hypothetical protein